jgi:hypothetical protein
MWTYTMPLGYYNDMLFVICIILTSTIPWPDGVVTSLFMKMSMQLSLLILTQRNINILKRSYT